MDDITDLDMTARKQSSRVRTARFPIWAMGFRFGQQHVLPDKVSIGFPHNGRLVNRLPSAQYDPIGRAAGIMNVNPSLVGVTVFR